MNNVAFFFSFPSLSSFAEDACIILDATRRTRFRLVYQLYKDGNTYVRSAFQRAPLRAQQHVFKVQLYVIYYVRHRGGAESPSAVFILLAEEYSTSLTGCHVPRTLDWGEQRTRDRGRSSTGWYTQAWHIWYAVRARKTESYFCPSLSPPYRTRAVRSTGALRVVITYSTIYSEDVLRKWVLKNQLSPDVRFSKFIGGW